MIQIRDDKPFGVVPQGLVEAMGKHSLGREALMVAIAMLSYARLDGYEHKDERKNLDPGMCNPSIRSLSKLTGLNDRNTARGLNQLLDTGLLEKVYQGTGRTQSKYKWNVWTCYAWGDPASQAPDKLDQPKPKPSKTDKPKQSKPVGDEDVMAILLGGGVEEPALSRMSSDPEMTVELAEQLVGVSAGKANPGGYAAKAWAGGWRGEGEHQEEEEIVGTKPTMSLTDCSDQINAERLGMSVKYFRMYKEEAGPLREQWEADTKGESEAEVYERLFKPLIEKYKQQERDEYQRTRGSK